MKPRAIPVAMLDVSGMLKTVKKAGKASSSSFHRIFAMLPIIRLPTMINAGAVIADIPETVLTRGPKKADKMNKMATVREVKPVRPPAATPDDDSI
jgi:hypothetical protein